LPANYESLAMPDETANYLPKLQAIKNIVRDPEKFGLALADIPDAPYFAVVKTNRKMDTKFAAELAEMSLEDFLALNPQHNRPVIAGADQQTLLLPIDSAEIFAAKLELTNQPMVSWQAYRMRPNETLAQVAAKYGMSLETLRAVNGTRSESEGAGRPYAARAFAKRVDRSGPRRCRKRSSPRSPRPHVLLHSEKGRPARGHRGAVWRDGAGIESMERHQQRRAGAGTEGARHQRRRACAQGRRTHQAGGSDQGCRQPVSGREVPGGKAGCREEQAVAPDLRRRSAARANAGHSRG
jgi:hypothetical protein